MSLGNLAADRNVALPWSLVARPARNSDWYRWYPPSGFRCRCSVIALTEDQARARGYGTKPTPNAQPDKGWDYHPAKGQDEALAAVESRKLSRTTGRMRDTYIKLRPSVQDGADLASLADVIRLREPAWMRPGQTIQAAPGLIGFAEETEAAIFLSASDNQVEGFFPSKALLGAVRKARGGARLSFNEEYAVEVLWHELQHARTRLTTSGIASEVVIQLAARHSYPRLATTLGITAEHQAQVLEAGYGYVYEVDTLRWMLRELRLDEQAAAAAFQDIIETADTGSVAWHAAQWLAAESGISHSSMRKALRQVKLHGAPGRRRILRDLSYGRSDHGTQGD